MSGKQGEWCRIGVNGGGFEGESMGHTPRNEPQTLKRGTVVFCRSYGWKSVCGGAYNLKGVKMKIYSFFFFLKLVSLLLQLISWHDACRPRGGGRKFV